MADAEAVVAGLEPREDVEFSALVLNERGYDRALAAGVRALNSVVSATDTFGERNQGMPVDEAVRAVSSMRKRAEADGVRFTVTISVAFGCPFEGEVALEQLGEVVARVAELGPDEIALADTIGVAAPSDVEERLAVVRGIDLASQLRLHFHNTRNTAVANAVAAVRCGVRCWTPRSRGSADALRPRSDGERRDRGRRLHALAHGLETGMDLEAAIEAARWVAGRARRSIRPGWWRGPAHSREIPPPGCVERFARAVGSEGVASDPQGRVRSTPSRGELPMAVREAEPLGSLQEVQEVGLDREDLFGLYRHMLTARGIEERGHILYKQGKIPGSFYTGRGNEAAAVGVGAAMGPDDVGCPIQRDMGVHITRGVEPWRIFAQYMGRDDGPDARPRRQRPPRRRAARACTRWSATCPRCSPWRSAWRSPSGSARSAGSRSRGAATAPRPAATRTRG